LYISAENYKHHKQQYSICTIQYMQGPLYSTTRDHYKGLEIS